jgi:hypothetical protein
MLQEFFCVHPSHIENKCAAHVLSCIHESKTITAKIGNIGITYVQPGRKQNHRSYLKKAGVKLS